MTRMFNDLKKAHLNAKCGEEEWLELADEFTKFGVCPAGGCMEWERQRPEGG